MSETKECKCCGKVLPIENFTEFFSKSRGKNYRYGTCDSCKSENAKKKYHSKTPEQRREEAQSKDSYAPLIRKGYKLKYKYNLTLEQYDNMLIEQDYGCSICGCKFDDNVKPYVDHCHKTGRVRGLACRSCNLVLGYCKDDPNILYFAADYLMGVKNPYLEVAKL